MFGIHPDYARIVNHLKQNHDMVITLHDTLKVVVQARQARWSSAEAE